MPQLVTWLVVIGKGMSHVSGPREDTPLPITTRHMASCGTKLYHKVILKSCAKSCILSIILLGASMAPSTCTYYTVPSLSHRTLWVKRHIHAPPVVQKPVISQGHLQNCLMQKPTIDSEAGVKLWHPIIYNT